MALKLIKIINNCLRTSKDISPKGQKNLCTKKVVRPKGSDIYLLIFEISYAHMAWTQRSYMPGLDPNKSWEEERRLSGISSSAYQKRIVDYRIRKEHFRTYKKRTEEIVESHYFCDFESKCFNTDKILLSVFVDLKRVFDTWF